MAEPIKFRKWDWVKITINNSVMLGLVIKTAGHGADIVLWYCDTRLGVEMRTSNVDLVWLARNPHAGSIERIPRAIALLLKPNEWRDYDSTN